MDYIPRTDFVQAYHSRFSPSFAHQLVNIVEDAARRSTDYCEQNFPSGNFAPTQGHVRRQFIHEGLFTSLSEDGVIPESRDFRGKLLDGDERVNNFVLLVSRDVGLTVYRASHQRPIPEGVPVRQYLSSLPFGMAPLFPDFMLDHEAMPQALRAMFFVGYWLHDTDTSGRTVSDIEVLVLDGNGESIYCKVADLRAHAAMQVDVMHSTDDELPMSFREHNGFQRDGDGSVSQQEDAVRDDG